MADSAVRVHSPDPSRYHVVAGGTMIPHVDGPEETTAGISRMPITVQIDPTNPLSGEGGTVVRFDPQDPKSGSALLQAVNARDADPPDSKPVGAGETRILETAVGEQTRAPQNLEDDLKTLLKNVLASIVNAPSQAPGPSAAQPVALALAQAPEPSFLVSPVLRQFVEAPRPPREPVVFDLGVGGIHRVHFHHVSLRGSSVFLYYDDRYTEGYRFLPPVTPPDQHVVVTFPNRNDLRLRVAVLPLTNTLEYIDIVQLLVLPEEPALPFFPPENARDSDAESSSSW